MRANSAARNRRFDEKAEVGVGTLIIFIAMVLVAAVAAAVIIGTSGSLEQRAQETGHEATAEVSSNLNVERVYGLRVDTSHDISTLRLMMTLSAGSTNVDLNAMVIRFSDGHTVTIYKHGGSPGFNMTWIRGTGLNNVMAPGDLAYLDIPLTSDLGPRSLVEVSLIPETGASVPLELTTPSSYGSDLELWIK